MKSKVKVMLSLAFGACIVGLSVFVSNISYDLMKCGSDSIGKTIKTKIYPGFLKKILKEKDKLKLTPKQKSQVESLIRKCENYGN